MQPVNLSSAEAQKDMHRINEWLATNLAKSIIREFSRPYGAIANIDSIARKNLSYHTSIPIAAVTIGTSSSTTTHDKKYKTFPDKRQIYKKLEPILRKLAQKSQMQFIISLSDPVEALDNCTYITADFSVKKRKWHSYYVVYADAHASAYVNL